jgi:hypothetical protein
MKLRDVAMTLIGGSVLYVAMAACAGPRSGPLSSHGPSGAGGATGHLGVGGSSGAGGRADSGLGDALGDPVSSAQADPLPGSRLKPKFRLGEDGAKEYLQGLWFDTQRGEDCSFQLAADGQTRCLPKGNTFQYYADAQCTQAMVLLQSACTTPAYGVTNVTTACALDTGGTHVFSVGTSTNPPMIYGKAGSSCFAIGPTSADYTYFMVGAEVPASSFVAATVGHD